MTTSSVNLSEDLVRGLRKEDGLSPGALNGLLGRLRERMGLDGDALGREFLASDHNLVDVELGLCGGTRLDQALEADSAPLLAAVDVIELDEVVFRLLMPRTRGPSGELGKAAVQRLLSSLEARPGGTAGAGLLAPHAEAARGALSGGDPPSLALLPLARSGSGLDGAERPLGFEVVHGGLVSGPSLPVVKFHGKLGGTARRDRVRGEVARRERAEARRRRGEGGQ
mmetsp:Transcript_8954/g.20818  ORF Transcript_8954/g.20818 Transcript_8954/m.20818 type:complete len:226 (+) Transcript_8954:118-795(+)